MGAEELIDGYLTNLREVRRLSENTVEGYASDLASYVAWLDRGGRDVLTVTHADLRRYLAEMSRARYATTTINRHLSAIRGFYSWLQIRGIEASGAAAALSSPKNAKRLPKTLTEDEAERLLATCADGCAVDLRDRAFLEFLYASGARISEASALDVRDIDFSLGQVRLFGKGSKERVVPLYDLALDWVGRYLREARPALLARAKGNVTEGDRDAVFISTRGRRMSAGALRVAFENRCAQAGLGSDVTPHAMRHTYATELLGGGADLRSVQELLGHENLATTQIYTHLSIDRLKDAARAAHPRA